MFDSAVLLHLLTHLLRLIQLYYYNARTRESAWTRPENVKIMSQTDVEAMAATQVRQDLPNQPPGVTAAAESTVGGNSRPVVGDSTPNVAALGMLLVHS